MAKLRNLLSTYVRGVSALLYAFVLCAPAIPAERPAPPLLFHASQSGERTLDEGEGGGNPFASALVELLAIEGLRLGDLPARLTALTVSKSHSFQLPDVPPKAVPQDWVFSPKPPADTRLALVVVFSDYSISGAPSLPGAKHDAARVAGAFERAGFQTRTRIDPSRA